MPVSKRTNWVGAAAVALSMGWAALPAHSAIMQVGVDFAGSDCVGFFGQPFEACTVFVDSSGQPIPLSPVIAKYETGDLGNPEINSAFPTWDGSEATITGDGTSSGTIAIDYGVGDPGVRFVVAKSANEFRLLWWVDAPVGGLTPPETCTGIQDDNYNLTCMDAAIVLTDEVAFDWSTPGGQDVSHLTVYDTSAGPGPGPGVPEPGVLGLFGLGLLGIASLRRRVRRA